MFDPVLELQKQKMDDIRREIAGYAADKAPAAPVRRFKRFVGRILITAGCSLIRCGDGDFCRPVRSCGLCKEV